MKELVIIDNYDSFTYNLVHYLQGLGCNVSVLRNDEIDYSLVDKCSHIVLSPGPGLPENSGGTMELIQKYYKEKSILGICLGQQCLGVFFGHPLSNLENVLHGKQSKVIVKDDNCLFKNLPKKFNIGHYHSWIIKENKESKLIVTSRLKTGGIMSIRHENLPIYGTQFHPESILTEHGKSILGNWLKLNQLN